MISPSKWIAGATVILACALSSLALADDAGAGIAADSRGEDDAFLLLRDAARQDDAAKADFYADRLANYPIS
ncbi:MAG TPA: lytic transglycosylase domain-containing protein, partial [Janthinobacterium sp.]|nr:lytic transglycosylase domain-containing protein [Janthinobacterium sp.]